MNKSEQKTYQNSGNEDVLKLVTGEAKLILDIGCGGGSLAEKLILSGKVIDGISISPNELQEAKEFLRQGYLFNLENGLPPEIKSNGYDCVICSHILEHIAYPEKLLEDIKNVLKPGGTLVVALPNLFHYKTRLQLLQGNFPYSETGIWDYTHVRWYTFKSALKLFSQNYIVDLATVTGELPFNSFFKKILPSRLSRFLYKNLIKISRGFFGYQLLFRLINKKES